MEIDDSGKMKNKNNSDVGDSDTWRQPQDANQEDDIDQEELNSLIDDQTMVDLDINLIDNQLNELNSALDKLEQKNDNIHEQLVKLLESNRQARKLFQEMQNQSIETEKKENPNSA